jgi:hypothetical protein
MSDRMTQMLYKGAQAVNIQARSDAEAAYKAKAMTPADLRDLSCPRRVEVAKRNAQKLVDLRGELKFKASRVVQKMHAMSPSQDERNHRLVAGALDTLELAVRRLDGEIRKARTTRKHAERSCRRR